jgi:hypothetical protein
VFPTASAPQDIPADPTHHPEWPAFRDGMRSHGVANDLARSAWGALMQGIALQGEMNGDGRRREDNPHFDAFADLLQPYLDLPDANLALWSGGFAVSDYARLRKNCTTLESTALGGVLDRLELYRDWKCIGPLWNTISKRFVEQGHGVARVFLRVHAPDSVLYRQEVPMLGINARITCLRWHALYGEGEWMSLREINDTGSLVDDHAFADEYHARIAMKNFLVRLSQARMQGHQSPSSNRAAQEMKID